MYNLAISYLMSIDNRNGSYFILWIKVLSFSMMKYHIVIVSKDFFENIYLNLKFLFHRNTHFGTLFIIIYLNRHEFETHAFFKNVSFLLENTNTQVANWLILVYFPFRNFPILDILVSYDFFGWCFSYQAFFVL